MNGEPGESKQQNGHFCYNHGLNATSSKLLKMDHLVFHERCFVIVIYFHKKSKTKHERSFIGRNRNTTERKVLYIRVVAVFYDGISFAVYMITLYDSFK